MKKNVNLLLVILLAMFFSFETKAQKGVWLPAGGDIAGFNNAAYVYQNNLYVSGMEYRGGGMPKSYIKKFNGTFWTTLIEMPGFNSTINAMVEYKGELYVAGSFNMIGETANTNSIARWNGKNWNSVGGGFSTTSYAQVRALEVYNNKLYVGGGFDSIAGISLNNMAVWDGISWSAGPRCESGSGMYSIVQSLKTFNSNLFIGGAFTKLNGNEFNNIARYDGTAFHTVSNGGGVGTNGEVAGFESYNNELYLHGYFSMLDTIGVNGIAKFATNQLRKLTVEPGASVQSLKAFNGFMYSSGAGWLSGVDYFDGSKWDGAGNTKLVGEGATLQVFRNRLFVLGGFISSDSSSFVFKGSAMLIDSADACMVEGIVYHDANKNCIQDETEPGMVRKVVTIHPLGLSVYTDSVGYFSMYLEKGIYGAKVQPVPYYGVSCSDSLAFSFTNIGQKTDTLRFGMFVRDTLFDADVKIAAARLARPGFPFEYYINLSSAGTASQNGVLKLYLDNNVNYTSVTGLGYSRVNGNIYEWDIKPLGAKQSIQIIVNGTIKVGTPLSILLKSYAWFVPATADANMGNNADTSFIYTRGSFDPNDKQVFPAGTGTNGLLGPNTAQKLRYHIRFQNTGTDTAFNIVILDTLSSYLSAETFEEGGSSHPYSFEMLPGHVLKFHFENVMLPDSNVNEKMSHGYVSFWISPRSSIALGTSIKNTADIYFDFNDPVRTNTTVSTFDQYGSAPVTRFANDKMVVYPNPGAGIMTVRMTDVDQQWQVFVFDLQGKCVANRLTSHDAADFDLTHFENGLYIIRAVSEAGEIRTGRYVKAN